MLTQIDVLVIFTAISIYVYLRFVSRKYGSLPLPPGPSGLPIIGNVLDIPKTQEWLTYMQWSQQYKSDIIHLNIAGSSAIIVNSAKAADELFVSRSSNYSSRPRMVMVNELMGYTWAFSFAPLGRFWQERRREAQRYLSPVACLAYRPQQLRSTHSLLRRLLHTPDEFMDHFRILSTDVVLSVVYGLEAHDKNNPHLVAAAKANEGLGLGLSWGAYLVEFMPILKFIPGAGFKQLAIQTHQAAMDMINAPFRVVQQEMALGTAPPSLLRAALEDRQGIPGAERDDFIKGVFGTMLSAASDTTTSVLFIFVLAMSKYPDAQTRAQKELDAVIGQGQLPTFDSNLPYVTAIVKEVLRWLPVLPLAIPHQAISEDTYEGYRIPAGATVIGNVWAILHDEVAYPNPDVFNPDRFIKDGQLNPDVRDPTQAWGFSRRACVGRHFATQTIWIVIASMLAMYEIRPLTDAGEREEDPYGETMIGATTRLLPFKCSIRPRSVDCDELMRSTAFTDNT